MDLDAKARRIAEDLVEECGLDVEFLTINERVADLGLDEKTHDSLVRKIDDLVSKASVKVSFSDDS